MRPGAVALVVIGAILILFFPFYIVQWIGYGIFLLVTLSFAYSRFVDAALQFSRNETDLTAYQHQTVVAEITIRNGSILPIPLLTVTDNPGSLYTGHENSRMMSLRSREESHLVYHIRGMNRGAYRIGPITVRFADPLGLFPVHRTVPKETRLIVYPRIYPVRLPIHRGLPAGRMATANRIYEDPTRYRSIREYVPGDEMRRINWKASARIGSLHSTEWLPTINYPVMIVLNLTADDYVPASLVYLLADRGQEVGLVTTGVIKGLEAGPMPWIRVGSGAQHAVGILETLAQLIPNRERVSCVEVFLERGQVSYGTRVFYMGPPLSEESVTALTSAVGDRSLVRLYYTDEGVRSWADLGSRLVHVWKITEFGDELFTLQS